jgi:hypothetical protein
MKKSLIAAALMGVMMTPGAVLAQDEAAATAPELAVGGTVYDPEGGVVGTIEKMAGGNVVISTGTNSATLGANAFVKGPNGPVIGMTKEELDAAVEQAAAKAQAAKDAALVPGAQVSSSDGVVVGTVDKIEGENVFLKLTDGAITLQKEHLTTGPEGLKLFMTAAQFQSAVTAAKQAQQAAQEEPAPAS